VAAVVRHRRTEALRPRKASPSSSQVRCGATRAAKVAIADHHADRDNPVLAGLSPARQVCGISRIEIHRRVARPLLPCLVMHEMKLMRSQWTRPKVERTSPRICRRSIPLLVLVAACAVAVVARRPRQAPTRSPSSHPRRSIAGLIPQAVGPPTGHGRREPRHGRDVGNLGPTVATVSGTDALGTVVAHKAGSTTITALASGATRMIPLTVAAYSASDLAAGATAYTTTYSCAKSGCHDASGPDVSPSGIAKHTDAQLVAVITAGENPRAARSRSVRRSIRSPSPPTRQRRAASAHTCGRSLPALRSPTSSRDGRRSTTQAVIPPTPSMRLTPTPSASGASVPAPIAAGWGFQCCGELGEEIGCAINLSSAEKKPG